MEEEEEERGSDGRSKRGGRGKKRGRGGKRGKIKRRGERTATCGSMRRKASCLGKESMQAQALKCVYCFFLSRWLRPFHSKRGRSTYWFMPDEYALLAYN